jgi:hypothetical protein
MRNWFCEFAEVDRRPGAPFVFGGRHTYRLGELSPTPASLLGFETGRSVTFAWTLASRVTRVRYLLSAVRGDCRLRVLHQCPGRPNHDWRGEIADHIPWEIYLLNLKMYLERGDAGIRADYDAVPEGRQSIRGELRCASERIWRVLTDREECARRAGDTGELELRPGEGWIEPYGKVRIADVVSGKRLTQRWEDPEGVVNVEWELISRGVASVLVLSTWGEGRAESWHEGRAGLWTYLLWCRAFNQLKYYSETGRLSGLRRLAGEG